MDPHVLRLIWALPLVLLVGLGAMLALKRLGIGVGVRLPRRGADPALPTLVSSTPLTDLTRVLVVQVDGQRMVVFESTANITVHTEPASAGYTRR